MPREPDQSLVGRKIAGKFAIESAIGGGAMGAVYKARQIALDKSVAIKVMHRELWTDATYVARFLREAKAASRIDHPASVRVIDFGEEPDGLLYLAMELLEGRDLYTLLREEGPLPRDRVGDILLQVLAAMAVAHEMGVVHRDIKPENIMIQRGTDDEGRPRDLVKACDFGVAKITDHRGEKSVTGPAITTEGLVVGTPEYMSPEQGRGEVLDARSDLYSVGIILYQMLAGRVPFDAESALGIVLKHVTEDPVPPSRLRPEADAALEAVCLRAIQKKKEDRYQTAREMRSDLKIALDPNAAVSTLNRRPISLAEAGEIVAAAPSQPAVVAAREPTPNVSAVATADTAVAFDSSAIRALAPSSPPISESPPALDAKVLKPRWAGLAIGLVLLVGAGGIVAMRFRDAARTDGATSATASASAAPSATTPSFTAPTAASVDVVPSAVAVRDSRGTKVVHANGRSSATPLAGSASAAPSASVGTRPLASDAPAASVSAAPVASTASSATAAPSASSAPAGAWDPAKAKVTVGRVNALGVAPEALRKEIPDAKIQQCYRAALTGKGPRPPVSKMTLHLDARADGHITGALLSGGPPIPPAAGDCVMHTMIGRTVTSEGAPLVNADVELSFSVE